MFPAIPAARSTVILVTMIFLLPLYASYGISSSQFQPTITSDLPTVNDAELRVETITEGLNFPASMAFLGPNDILVTEKNNGTVQRIINGTIQPFPLLDISVATRAERGMLGIAIPDNGNGTGTEADRFVYIYFTKSVTNNDSNGTARGEKTGGNHVYRYELKDSSLTDAKELLNFSNQKGFAHNGGALIIGPDNNLYIPIGDADGYSNSTNFPLHKTEAQNVIGGPPLDGTGGILTVTIEGLSYSNILGDGEIPSKYYAYGIRNSFGIDFDPVTGKLWDTENGEDHADEINLVEPGFNSGWKKVQGKAPVDFNYSELVTFEGKGKYSDPEFSWTEPVGPTKIKFLSSDKFGEKYENDLFVSDIKYGRIYHFDLNEKRDGLILSDVLADKVADSDEESMELVFGSGFGGITDMDLGPDGNLYVLSFGKGAIYRISPK